MPGTSPDALTTARAYHDAWTAGDFERATALLSEALHVEVPINAYPSKAVFAAALAGFGEMVEGAEMLSEIGDGAEAMLLYDMQVGRLGTIRMVEHFTVEAGEIVRLRQIHDTTVIRQAGLGPSGGSDPDDDVLCASTAVGVSTDRAFAALTTLDGLRAWWTPSVTGSPRAGGELQFRFEPVRELIRVRVDTLIPNRALTWTCLEHTGDRDWINSRLEFELADTATGCTLCLTHSGIAARRVKAGWEHFLTSLTEYLETGTGRPYDGS